MAHIILGNAYFVDRFEEAVKLHLDLVHIIAILLFSNASQVMQGSQGPLYTNFDVRILGTTMPFDMWNILWICASLHSPLKLPFYCTWFMPIQGYYLRDLFVLGQILNIDLHVGKKMDFETHFSMPLSFKLI